MIVIINDLSFMFSFSDKYAAFSAIKDLAFLLQIIKDKKVRNVDALDIKVPTSVTGEMQIAPSYTFIDSIKDLRDQDRNLGVFLLTIITKQCIEIDTTISPFVLLEKKSFVCSHYHDSFFLSLCSNEVFNAKLVEGKVSNDYVSIKNISSITHINDYWKNLGYREYEESEKHGPNEYTRNGVIVSVAPKTVEEGQELLNNSIIVDGHTYGVDKEDEKIYEFHNHQDNKFHGYLNNQLPKDLRKKILKEYNKRI